MAALAILLLVLFLFRPGVHQFRNRVADSIGSALGRRVALNDVHIHLLPRPGFDLDGLVIYDDPAFSAEPMIVAQDVFAAIRIRSLLRGRLDIATLSATEPSINLVRDVYGRWNLARLIERNSQIAASPTEPANGTGRRPFPYLEATGARINFKIVQEKKAYALGDADVALWQESDNSWGARLKAVPLRTDVSLSDTGRVDVNATWQRAPNLRQTPMQVTVAWQKGQLGQITKLFTGRDRGWRGAVEIAANLSGTPESLALETGATIDGFRRYDILSGRSLHLATMCKGNYDATSFAVTGLDCVSPVATGSLRLKGSASAAPGTPSYDLTFIADKVPVASVAGLLREAKQRLPRDLTATGTIDAEFAVRRIPAGPPQFSGTGIAKNVSIASAAAKESVSVADIPLALLDWNCCQTARAGKGLPTKTTEPEPEEAHLRIGPISARVNDGSPLSAGGWVSTAGYRFFLRGDSELKDLARLEDLLGIPARPLTANGTVKLDMAVTGPWQGLSAPLAVGTASIRNVHAEIRGLNVPVEIASAAVSFTSAAASFQAIVANTGGTHWTGWVTAPRQCAPNCDYAFDLSADQLSTTDFVDWMVPQPKSRPWYRILSPSERHDPSHLLALKAHGNLRIARFSVKKLLATECRTQVTLDRGKIGLKDFHAQVLQGSHAGEWSVDASTTPPRYHGVGNLQDISLSQVATLMENAWVTGKASGSFDLQSAGKSFQDLVSNAEGSAQFVMRDGSFTRFELPRTHVPLSVFRFGGNLSVTKNSWKLEGGRLQSRDGFYEVSGTTSPADGLDFWLKRADGKSWNITGTLAKPRVEAASKPAKEHSEPN